MYILIASMALLLLSTMSWFAAKRVVAIYVEDLKKYSETPFPWTIHILAGLSVVSFVLGAIGVFASFMITLTG